MGEEEWKSASDQAENIPEGVLEIIKEKAMQAFCDMRPAGPLIPYSEIFQGPSEPFVAFVEKLTTAIEQQVTRVYAREQILEEMVSKHSCREIILRIPKQPGEHPTLEEMLRAVNAATADSRARVPPPPERRRGGPRVAVVQKGEEVKTPGAARRPPGDRPCFLCGRKGHWSSQCPKRKDFDEFMKKEGERGRTKQKN